MHPRLVRDGGEREGRGPARADVDEAVARGEVRVEREPRVAAVVSLRAVVAVVARPVAAPRAGSESVQRREKEGGADQAPELPSGTIRIGPGSACFLPCTFVTSGMLHEWSATIEDGSECRTGHTCLPWAAASSST